MEASQQSGRNQGVDEGVLTVKDKQRGCRGRLVLSVVLFGNNLSSVAQSE
jgi:hypothetical protein